MKHASLLTRAALVLAAVLGAPALLAQTTAQTTAPTPPVMTDAAPLPASERGSIGAVLLEDSPVLAQREAFERLAARNEAILLAFDPARDATRSMGAGPAPDSDAQKKKKSRKPGAVQSK